MFRLVALPHPFSSERTVQELAPGPSIRDLVEKVQPLPELQHAHVLIGDGRIPEAEWNTRRPEDGDLVIIRAIPAGSPEAGAKATGWAGILALIVGVVLLFVPGMAGLGGVLIGTGIGLASGGFGVYTVLNLLSPMGEAEREDSPPSIRGARNQANNWGSVPVILGKHLVVPPYGALPYTEIVGEDQYLRLLFVLGYSPMTVEDLKIGDTDIDEFDDVEYEVLQDTTPSTLFPDQIIEEALNVLLEQSAGGQVRTTETDTDEVSVDITFPQGLVEFEDDGDKSSLTVVVTCEYSPTGESNWTLFHTFNINAAQQKTLRYGKRYTLPVRGQYDVRLTRTTADRTGSGQYDKVYWTALRSIAVEDPVAASIRGKVVRVAMRIKATDQLSGIVDQFNAVCTSKVPTYSGSGSGAAQWTTVAASQNPAALLLYLLRGEPNPKPVPDDRIDWPAFEAWYQWCASSGHTCNAVHGRGEALRTILNRIASTGRASVSVRDGKYSVIYDIERTTVIQLFTPRNSWGFEGQKAFVDPPHALKLRFISEPAGWQQDELTVYDDGYSADGAGETEVATEFKTVEVWGITDPDQLWQDGRYQLAAIKLRPEIYSFYADVESIVCQRGDLIRVQHDAPLLGISSGRIKSLTTDGEGDVLSMVGDETFLMTGGYSYAVRIRKADNTYLTEAVDTEAGEQTEITFATPIPAAQAPAVGDLYSFGLQDSETAEMVVIGIEMGEELEAKIYCVDHSPAIYDADTGEIPEYDPQVTLPADYQGVPDPPAIVNIRSDGTVLLASGGDYITQMLVTLAPGASGPSLIDHYEVQYRQNLTEDLWASVTLTGAVVGIVDVIDGVTYDVRARAWGHGGEPSAWTPTTHAVQGKTAAPSNVTGLAAALGANGVTLTWSAVPDLDLAYYEVRKGASWGAGEVLYQGKSTQFIWLPDENATHTFRVKAVDTTGHESSTDASVAVPTFGLLLSYAGGDVQSPVEGDRRVYVDEDEIALQEYRDGEWSTERQIALGGVDADGFFVPMIGCRGMYNSEESKPDYELPPVGAYAWDFDEAIDSDLFDDFEWEVQYNVTLASGGKFGYCVTRDADSNGWFATFYPGWTPGESQCISFWFKAGTNDSSTHGLVNLVEIHDDGANPDRYTGLYLSIDGANARLVLKCYANDLLVSPSFTLNTSSSVISDNTWHFVAFGYLKGTNKLYIVVDDTAWTTDGPTDWTAPGTLLFSILDNNCQPGGASGRQFWYDDYMLMIDDSPNTDFLITHHSRDRAWVANYSTLDLVLKPATGGKVRLLGDVAITGDLSVTGSIPGGGYLFPAGAANAPDLTLSAARTQRVLYCNDLTIDTNMTLTCNRIVCEGNFTIDAGVTLTIATPASTYQSLPGFPGRTSLSIFGGFGAFGGANGGYGGVNPAGGGGSSISATGAADGGGVTASQALSGITIGGNGGIGYKGGGYGGGSGGGGPCAGGGAGGPTVNGYGGAGGPILVVICKGNFVNNGIITCNGSVGSVSGTVGGGGGGGGLVIIIALGSVFTGGTINAAGGAGANASVDGGGGGGGHIEVYAKTDTFGTLNVPGGSGPGSAADGATGTTRTVNISTDPSSLLGGKAADEEAGLILPLLGGIP